MTCPKLVQNSTIEYTIVSVNSSMVKVYQLIMHQEYH